MNNKEIWKDVKGYEGLYQVSSKGRVKSLDRSCLTKKGNKRFRACRILKPYTQKDGYKQVDLRNSIKPKTATIHRLVAKAFIPNPHNYPQVNHIESKN